MTEKDISDSKGGLVITGEDEINKISDDLLQRAASAEVRNEDEFSPNTLVTVTVPESGFWEQEEDSIQTEFRFIEGDLSPILTDSPLAAIRFELKNFQDHHLDYIKKVAKKGGRIFVTESDSYLIVHSEKSLQHKEKQIAS